MPFLKAKKIREEKEKEKNIQTAEPVEISVSEPEPIQEPKSEQTVTDNVDENPGEKIEATHEPDSTSTNEAGENNETIEEIEEIEKEENNSDGEPENKEEITEENSDSNSEDKNKDETQTSNVQVVEEVPGISEDSTPDENKNPDGQETHGDGGDNAGETEGGESTGQDGDGTSGTGSIGGTGSSTGGGTSGGEIEDEYDFDSNERYVDKVSTKTEFDKVLDSLAAISKDLLSHEVERFAKKYADKYQGNFTKAEADAKKYEAFLGGYITNAAMTLYDNNYREAAIRQLEQAKSVLIARQRLEEETSAIKERVEEEGAAVDLSDILGMFGDG